MSHLFHAGQAFAWSHKELIIGGAIIGIAMLLIFHYWKNRLRLPTVKLESSLHVARLSISIPDGKFVPPNATLTFCVDTSRSMDEEDRLKDVKSSMNDILDSAQKVIDGSNGAHIEISVISFDENAHVIVPATKLIRTENGRTESSVVTDVKNQMQALVPRGGTSIKEGLEKGTEQLEEMAGKNRKGSHTIILLTDGEDNNLKAHEILAFQARLAAAKAKLFAIGIGKHHNKFILEQIADSSKEGFQGKYIDTTLGNETIASAISKIYAQAVATFGDLELSSALLEAGTWSIDGTESVSINGVSACPLGSLSAGSDLMKGIELHGDRLSAPVDLSAVEFTLNFKDPRGKQGKLLLPWNPNTIIDPEIVKLV